MRWPRWPLFALAGVLLAAALGWCANRHAARDRIADDAARDSIAVAREDARRARDSARAYAADNARLRTAADSLTVRADAEAAQVQALLERPPRVVRIPVRDSAATGGTGRVDTAAYVPLADYLVLGRGCEAAITGYQRAGDTLRAAERACGHRAVAESTRASAIQRELAAVRRTVLTPAQRVVHDLKVATVAGVVGATLCAVFCGR